jgi:hypothetical protein
VREGREKSDGGEETKKRYRIEINRKGYNIRKTIMYR